MHYSAAEKFITQLLQTQLSPLLYYHDYSHTISVLNAATTIAYEEGIKSEEDLLLLKTAALYHDSGYVNVIEKHEEEGCRIARETLPQFNYSENHLTIICNMIMKTKLPSKPETLLEKILCDADLNHLGTEDFDRISKKLFLEWMEVGKIQNEKMFNELQIKFLESHHFWTKSAALKRESKKSEHLQRLMTIV